MSLENFETLDTKSLIAHEPANPRDSSKLLVINRKNANIEHGIFSDIVGYLNPGDCLVLNNSKVFPAKLLGHKKVTGGQAEILLVRPLQKPNEWLVLAKKCRPRMQFSFKEGLEATALEMTKTGEWIFEFSSPDVLEYAIKHGHMPLPHYIVKTRKEKNLPEDIDNPDKYQTTYSSDIGSIAAPTAGFHFTKELLSKIEKKGIDIAYVTLHVGWGTFKPIRTEDPKDHKMLAEFATINEDTAKKINSAILKGNRVISVGTTSTRTLESFAKKDSNGKYIVESGSKWTELFIFPSYEFKIINSLITNFHLPNSTPLLLTSAFAGEDLLYKAYVSAVERKYRFYSFGDATLVL
jgi:S-adenosylmethionine:tRNA ribosyltransferase-isomerase